MPWPTVACCASPTGTLPTGTLPTGILPTGTLPTEPIRSRTIAAAAGLARSLTRQGSRTNPASSTNHRDADRVPGLRQVGRGHGDLVDVRRVRRGVAERDGVTARGQPDGQLNRVELVPAVGVAGIRGLVRAGRGADGETPVDQVGVVIAGPGPLVVRIADH